MSHSSHSSPREITLATQQAIDWFYRHSDGTLSADEQAAFDRWMCFEEHATEYHRLTQVWADMDDLPLAAMLAQVTPAPVEHQPVKHQSIRPGIWQRLGNYFLPWRRQTVWACAAMVMMIAGAWYVPLDTVTVQTDKHTPLAGSPLVLSDGSRIYANVDTSLTVRYTLLRRTVHLAHGEAFFEVTPNTWRPFMVATDRATVNVTGTSFNVLSDAGGTEVAVRSGHVQVTPVGGTMTALLAGQMLSVKPHGAPVQTAAREPWSWREGVLVVHDASLQEVMQTLRRYALPAVIFNDARASSYRLSGTIDLAEPAQFIHALPSLVPVRILEKTDGTLIIVSRNHK